MHLGGFAQLQVGFTPRFSDAVYGDFLTIGNNMLSTTATGSYTGEEGNHNLTTVFVDIDADASTFNSSSANLADPIPNTSCIYIKKAYLYWAAADFEEANIANEPNWNFNQVKLMLPGSATYTTITADATIFRGRTSHFVNDPYVCFKDITADVQALTSPYGKYQLANVRTKKGTLNPDHTGSNVGTSGGWQIVFVYEGTEITPQGNSFLPAKYISVFDGYANVTSSQNNYNITISGFQTPPTGNISTKILFGSLEGDRDLSGDQFQIRNVANTFINLTTSTVSPIRSTTNFFNSRITVENSNFINRNPASTNTTGFDAGYFTLNNPSNTVITNNQTSAVFRLTSNQETYGLYALGFSTDVWAPDLSPMLLTTSPTFVAPGGTITNTFVVDNTGNDNAVNVVITVTIPQEMDLVQPVAPLPAGVTYTYNAGTRLLSFFIQNGLVDINDPAITISYQTVLKDQCYFLTSACQLGRDVQLLATYNGVQNPAQHTTLSSNGLTPCGLGNDKKNSLIYSQPTPANWATAAGALNRTVNCNDASALAAAQALFPATDKCTFTLNKVSGAFVPAANSCPVLGTYTNTWTFTDACGNVSPVYTQVITVQDTTRPVFNGALPGNTTVSCNAVPTAPTLTATDNCTSGTVTYAEVRTNGNCPNNYILTRTWTAKDQCNNTTVHTQAITVQDVVAPTISGTPQNTTVSCASNVPAASPASVTATDNCPGTVTITVNDVITNQTCANRFTITRTWIATDVCGNSSTTSQVITVNDQTAPTISGTPQNVTVSCAANVPAASPSTVSATDNCAGQVTVTVNDVITNQTCANRFTITRTWTATDVCGNSSTSSQVITVNDQTAPTISGTPQNVTVSCAANVPAASPSTVSATDNCAGQVTVTVNDVITNQTCANRFTITRTWTATDVCGNSATSTQIITVNDQTAPTISGTPQNVTVSCAANVPAASPGSVTATDNCAGQVTVTVNDVTSTPTCPNRFTITRTWTATDVCGNSATSTQIITVNDQTAPTISGTPQNVTVSCAANVPAASPTTVSTTDNCAGQVTVTVNDVTTNQTCANRFTITRTWTATDVCGNSATSTQIITVNDQTAPTINGTPQNVTVSCAANVPAASPTTVSATDNCAGQVTVTVNDVITNQTCANRFTITRTWTATDVCGNSATSTQIITVNDQTAPTISGTPQNVTVSCAANVPAASPTTVSATDNCAGQVTVTVNDVTTNQTCANRFTITRTWTATDVCGNSATSSQTIVVNDQTAPVISGTPQNVTVSCAANVPAASPTTVSATDNCAGTVTVTVNDVISNQTCLNRFTITRTWTATDICGNSATSSQVIIVNEQTAPVFSGNLPSDVTVNCDAVPTAPTFTATDNCGPARVHYNEVRSNGNCPNYTLTRTWTATDTCGNTATHVQTITVQDTSRPQFVGNLPGDVTVNCDAVPGPATLTTNDNCGSAPVVYNEIRTNGNCPNNYILTRTWTATDQCQNTISHTQVVTVQDVSSPTISGTPQNITVSCASNVPAASPTTVTATDNCAGQVTVTVNDVISNQTCANRFTITRTWTATDVCGNSSATSQTITVNDQTPPVISGTPQNITVSCAAAVPASSTTTVTATDNCAGQVSVSVNDVTTNQTCANRFTITRTWTATDVCGNSSTTSQVITVNDQTAPVISGTPQNVTVSCAADVPAASSSTVSATDNCAGQVTVTVNDVTSTPACANRFTITRTWTATDVCGNSSTSTQIITVNDQTAPVISGTPQNITVSCLADVPAASPSTVTATDNCAGQVTVTVNDVVSNITCTNRFTVTRTWTAVDICGNSSTSTQIITVNDQAPPTITGVPQNITVSCLTDVPVGDPLTVTATDNCAGQVTVRVSDVVSQFSCANRFTITRTWIAVDVCGNFADASQVITVDDQDPPTISGTPQALTVSCASLVPAASINSVSATDNCTGTVTVTVSDAISNQTCLNRYTITRTWTATDVCGNSSSSSQTITVNDQEAPVFNGNLPQDETVNCDAIPQAPVLTATDNCGPARVTYNEVRSNGNCPNYTLTRTWSATDTCGNTATHVQVVTVQDTTRPQFIGNLPANITVNCDAVPGPATLSTNDNCGSAPVIFNEVRTNGNCANSYILTRTWSATDACQNVISHTQIVTVQDTTKPTISGTPQNITVSCAADVPQGSIASITASDNCSSGAGIMVTVNDAITNQTCASRFTITRTWTASDECGNSATSSQVITVDDQAAPVISGTPQGITVNCAADVPAASTSSVTATDHCAGQVTVTVDDVTTPGNCANKFTVTRTWTATDVCGNSATSSQTITVDDQTPPTISGTPQDITVSCTADVPAGSTSSVTATDNCAGQVTITVSDVTRGQTCDHRYTIARTWTATDVCGNSSTSTQIITVDDQTAPTISGTPQDITVSCAADVPAGSTTSVSATDNCTGQVTVTVNDVISGQTCANKFLITRTWTATDVCGNSSAVSQFITVDDQTAPSFTSTLPGDITVCDVVPQAPAVTATDNCGSATVQLTEVIDSISTPGVKIYTRTWTATDACGNISMHNQFITVNQSVRITQRPAICDGGSITVGNNVYTQTGTYVDTLGAANNCDSIVTTVLTVNPLPQADLSIIGQGVLCQGDSITLIINTDPNNDIDWLKNDTLIIGASGTSLPIEETAEYSAIITNGFGCSVRIDSFVVVNVTPISNINSVFDSVLCDGDIIELLADSGYTNYQWYNDGIPIQGANGNTYTVNTSGNYSVQIQNQAGCQQISREQNIRFDPLPQAFIDGAQDPLCPGFTITLSSSNTHAVYQWYKDGVLLQGQTNQTLVVDMPGQYVLVCADSSCSASDTVDVDFFTGCSGPPDANDDCVLETAKNTDIPIDVLGNDVDPDGDPLIVQAIVVEPKWGTAVIGTNGSNIVYYPNTNFCGRDTLYYSMCDNRDGCDTAMVCIKVNCICETPQVITPNGDGFNDNLFFPCISQVEGARLLVWHRWGLVVYEDTNYKNDFNGTLRGELLPAGTYWYSLEYIDAESKEPVKEVNYFMIIN